MKTTQSGRCLAREDLSSLPRSHIKKKKKNQPDVGVLSAIPALGRHRQVDPWGPFGNQSCLFEGSMSVREISKIRVDGSQVMILTVVFQPPQMHVYLLTNTHTCAWAHAYTLTQNLTKLNRTDKRHAYWLLFTFRKISPYYVTLKIFKICLIKLIAF